MHLYRVFSARMLAGQLPYRDFFVEYQPGSIPAFIVPGEISQQHYQFVFRLEMALLGGLALVAAVAAAAAAGFTRRQLWRAAAGIGLLPFALGPTVLNGFDLWPAALTVIAVLAFVLGRDTTAAGVIGLGAATKVFPVVLLPLVLVAALRRSGREGLRRAGAAFVAVAVLANAFFLVVGPGGLRFSYWVQAKRGLEDQSLLGSLLMGLDHAGLTHIAFAVRPPGSLDAVGVTGQALGVVTTLLELGAVVLVCVLFARRRPSADSTFTASAAAVAGFIAFGKVFSAQYLVWLLPLVPLVRGVRGLAAWVALAVAAAVTSLWVLSVVDPFAPSDAIWLVVFRNLLVVGLYALLVSALRSDPEKIQTSTSRPAAQSTNSSGKLA